MRTRTGHPPGRPPTHSTPLPPVLLRPDSVGRGEQVVRDQRRQGCGRGGGPGPLTRSGSEPRVEPSETYKNLSVLKEGLWQGVGEQDGRAGGVPSRRSFLAGPESEVPRPWVAPVVPGARGRVRPAAAQRGGFRGRQGRGRGKLAPCD